MNHSSNAPETGLVPADSRAYFDAHGYCVVPLFSAADLEYLRAGYAHLAGETDAGFHATMYSSRPDYRKAVFECIAPLVAERVRGVLRGFTVRVANWVVKEAGPAASAVGFHQDWSFVDEERHRSLNLWFPLIDVDSENGCLEVVAGSHRVSTDHRSHGDPCRFADLAAVLRATYTVPLPLTAGEGIIYDGALLHASGDNRSSERRIAIGTVLVPSDAQVVHCYRVSPATVEVFAVDDSFFWRHKPGARPEDVDLIATVNSSSAQHGPAVLHMLRTHG